MKAVDYIKKMLDESFRVMLNPKKHWKDVNTSADLLEMGWFMFYLPGFLLVFLAIFLGDLLFESEYGFLFTDTIIKAIRKVLHLSLMLWAANMLIFEISKSFHVPVSHENSRKMASYALLPVLFVTIVAGLFPFMDIVGLVGFYSLYLVYSALNLLYDIHFKKNTSYVIVLLSSLFLAFAFIGFLLSKLTALIIY
ncbi:MAG: Yip1 family protein [Prolixibacteraceae bacterium]